MEQWMVSAKRDDFQGIAERFNIDQVTARIMRNRDVIGDDEIRTFLYGNMDEIASPWLLKDMDVAIQIAEQKIHENKTIRIIGDYDIDGIMATYILLQGLQRVNANVDTYIPDRVADGYGLNEEQIEKAYEDQIDTIITCDNGIAAIEPIRRAKELGMTVIITDHHQVKFQETPEGREYIIPVADAVIDPHQEGCAYPFKGICGAVVAMKFIAALYERFGIPMNEVESFYQYAGFATVGDVMSLKGENRVLVKDALRRLKNTDNIGLRELIRINNLHLNREIKACNIGYILGPCINASGRMDTALRSLELLCARTQEDASRLAADLKDLNDTRKALTERWKQIAFDLVENTSLKDDRILVVFLPECHESLAGLIAGKLRERYNKPAIVLTRGATHVKGSGRSIEAYNMNENLAKCDDLFLGWGGHPMAAGVNLLEENVDEFRRRVNELCTLTEADLVKKILIDVPMPLEYVTKDLIREFDVLEPFGNGNEKPIFAQKDLMVSNIKIIGNNHNAIKMCLTDNKGNRFEGIYYNEIDEFMQYTSNKPTISIVYYPRINAYKGIESIQFVINSYK